MTSQHQTTYVSAGRTVWRSQKNSTKFTYLVRNTLFLLSCALSANQPGTSAPVCARLPLLLYEKTVVERPSPRRVCGVDELACDRLLPMDRQPRPAGARCPVHGDICAVPRFRNAITRCSASFVGPSSFMWTVKTECGENSDGCDRARLADRPNVELTPNTERSEQ